MNSIKKTKKSYESGEVRVGLTSPGKDWIRADGTVISNSPLARKMPLFSRCPGINWQTSSSSYTYCAAYGDNKWVIGGSRIIVSTDASTWVANQTNVINGYVRTIAYGNGLWAYMTTVGDFKTSTDAISWVSRPSIAGSGSGGWRLLYNNNLWIAVGGVAAGGGAAFPWIYTSTDAVTWVSRNSNIPSTQNVQNVAYGNGQYVAIGSSGAISTSTDAVTWVSQNSNITTGLSYVAYGKNWLVATGGNYATSPSDILRSSTDGVTWTTVTLNLSGGSSLTNPTFCVGIAYQDGMWLLVNYYDIFSSYDGINWQVEPNFTQADKREFQIRFSSVDIGNNGAIVGGYIPYQGMVFYIKSLSAYKKALPYINYDNGFWGWIKK